MSYIKATSAIFLSKPFEIRLLYGVIRKTAVYHHSNVASIAEKRKKPFEFKLLTLSPLPISSASETISETIAKQLSQPTNPFSALIKDAEGFLRP